MLTLMLIYTSSRDNGSKFPSHLLILFKVGVGRARPFAGVMLYGHLHDYFTVAMSEFRRLGRPSGFLVHAPVYKNADAEGIETDKKTKIERPLSNLPGLR
jgi:hypothetical protein